eukprot:scaffold27021_cov21-Tisochrysis_lutea.AAC.1
MQTAALCGASAPPSTPFNLSCPRVVLTLARLASAQDCTARVWDTRTGRQIAFIMTDAALQTVCFAGESCPDILVVGDVAGHMHFLDFPPELHAANAPTF